MPGPPTTYQTYGVAWASASNTPFRLYKHRVHEGKIATPFIAHWPAVIAPGGVTEQQGRLIHIMATCVELARAADPKSFDEHDIVPLEDKGLMPLLAGKETPIHDTLFWEHEGNCAVREGQWKMVRQLDRD